MLYVVAVHVINEPDAAIGYNFTHPAGPGTAQPPVTTQARLYVVKRGDTLSTIAKRLHITGGWRALFNLNRGEIDDPDRIFPGQVLKLP